MGSIINVGVTKSHPTFCCSKLVLYLVDNGILLLTFLFHSSYII